MDKTVCTPIWLEGTFGDIKRIDIVVDWEKKEIHFDMEGQTRCHTIGDPNGQICDIAILPHTVHE